MNDHTYNTALDNLHRYESFSEEKQEVVAIHLQTPLITPDPAGAWSDLPETLLEDLEALRHSNPPTPPIEDL